MKRFAIRMTTLATVVVLGWFAIAQAQRHMEVAGESPPGLLPAERAGAQPIRPVAYHEYETGAQGAYGASHLPVPAANNPQASADNPLREVRQLPRPPRRADGAGATASPVGHWDQELTPPRFPGIDPFGDGPATVEDVSEAGASEAAAGLHRAWSPDETAPVGLGPSAWGREAASAEELGVAPPTAYAHGAEEQASQPEWPSAVGDEDGLAPAPAVAHGEADRLAEPGQFTPEGGPAAALPRSADGPSGVPPRFENAFAGAESPAGTGSGPPQRRGDLGAAEPGDVELEGPQLPQLHVHKSAPDELQVGKPAVFRTTVRNIGQSPARDVEVHDALPRGAELVATRPRAARGPGGEFVWSLGTLDPGQEVSMEIEVTPVTEGEIGSVASVLFRAEASARARVTRPELVLTASAPEEVLIGEELLLSITVSNPGTGVATGVVLEERVPAGLEHPAGEELEYEVGDLQPNESRTLELTLRAAQAGTATNLLTARADGDLVVEDRRTIEVVAPRLEVAVEGPRRRFLEREATYELIVSNPGTAAARHVELAAHLPPGMQFVAANNAGHFEPSTNTVHWLLEQLPARESGSVQLTALPVELGEQQIRLRGTAQQGLVAEQEQPVLVEGIAAVQFQVADLTAPIEVGGETSYEIRVLNQGTKAASDVQVAVILPAELKPLGAEGPVAYRIEGNRVLFEGLSRLAPKADTTYRVHVQGLRAGDLRTRVQVLTSEMTTPVTKEESTRVYADQ